MKIQCQPNVPVSSPPTVGPTIAASPQVAPSSPSAEPRASGGDAIGDRGGRDRKDSARADRL